MSSLLTKNQLCLQINHWLAEKITSTQLAIWAEECRQNWEDDQLQLELDK